MTSEREPRNTDPHPWNDVETRHEAAVRLWRERRDRLTVWFARGVVALIFVPVFYVCAYYEWNRRFPEWLYQSRPGLTLTDVERFAGRSMSPLPSTGMPPDILRVDGAPRARDSARCVVQSDLGQWGVLGVSSDAAVPIGTAVRRFPVGTLIYKVLDANGPYGPFVVAMRKREPGYDPQHGDWDYLFGLRKQKFESGRIRRCVACHSSAAGADHVFTVSTVVH